MSSNVSRSFSARLAKHKYRELVQKQIEHKAISLELVIQIAAQGDRATNDKDEVKFGHGQRSALRVLLRALGKWQSEQ